MGEDVGGAVLVLAILCFAAGMALGIASVCSKRPVVKEWNEVSSKYTTAVQRIPSTVEWNGVEYVCILKEAKE